MEAVFSDGAVAPPCPAPFNLAEYVLARAKDDPTKTALALVGGPRDDSLSYGTLEAKVRRTAGGLRARGLVPGDRVLLRLGNTPDFPIAFLACVAVGLIPVPTSAQLTAPEVERIVAETRPALVLSSPGVALPEVEDLRILDPDGFADLAQSEPAEYLRDDPDRPAYYIYTSGSSGRPRAVVHAHRAVWARRMMLDGWYGLRADDRMMHAGAFNWTYTLGTGLFDPWSFGATALVPASGTVIEALPALMQQHGATLFAAAPGVYRRLLRAPFPPLPSLRHGLSAGEKLPAATLKAWRHKTGKDIYEAFGMSECSTFVSGSPQRPAPENSIGYPQPGRQIAILRPDDRPANRGELGEIAVHHTDPGLMLGYLNGGGVSLERLTPDGQWFRTGDMGEMAEDGALTYRGRADDMMNAGGYRVSPLEVEAVLGQHPTVTDVACVEVSVKADTSIIAAFYCAEHEIEIAALSGFTSDRLARYKCPKLFIHTPMLPRSANGKLMRARLRQDFEASHGQT